SCRPHPECNSAIQQITNPCHYPHLLESFLSETNANPARTRHPATVRDSLKPRSRVGRSRWIERQLPMTIRLRPLIKPDGRISRIRLSEPLHCPAFVRDGLGWAIQRASEYSKHWWDYYLLRAISRSFTPLSRVRTRSAPSCRVEAGPITKPTQCGPTM